MFLNRLLFIAVVLTAGATALPAQGPGARLGISQPVAHATMSPTARAMIVRPGHNYALQGALLGFAVGAAIGLIHPIGCECSQAYGVIGLGLIGALVGLVIGGVISN
jgi:hypothetical protein